MNLAPAPADRNAAPDSADEGLSAAAKAAANADADADGNRATNAPRDAPASAAANMAAKAGPSPIASADNASDDQLMRSFAAGDGSAFEHLYLRHQAALYRFVRRLLGRHAGAQADEVFQDTWLRAIEARQRWQPQGASFRTWLFTLAHHRAVDCLRRTGREVSADGPGDADDDRPPFEPAGAAWAAWPAPTAATEDSVHWRAAGQRLLDCLETLPVAQKAAFLLHHEDGLSVDELARVLELGFETAKTRLRYAMSKLRTCMGAYLADPALR
jgi:RNA polymerase sigma-70 factor (ECF subfamily)